MRGSGIDSTSYATYNGHWPLFIDLEDNGCTLGGNLTLPAGTLFVSGAATLGSLNSNCLIRAENAGAGEGGQLVLEKPTNVGCTLAGNVAIDINGNLFRIFENGGINRGLTFDLTGCTSQSTLLHSTNYNSYTPTLTGTGASGTWVINISGTAANAGLLDSLDSTQFLRADVSASLGGRLSLNGHGFAISDKVDISNRVDSGFWQNSAATAATGWPSTSNSNWWHCISATHSNESNYYSMQFASSFFNSNELYFRQTNNSGTTGWFKMFHSGNFEAWFGIGSNYTAVNRDCILAETSAIPFTITLPASPTQGMFVKIADGGGTFATNNLTVARNGSNILGSATDLVLDVNNDSVYLVYYGGTRGWILA